MYIGVTLFLMRVDLRNSKNGNVFFNQEWAPMGSQILKTLRLVALMTFDPNNN